MADPRSQVTQEAALVVTDAAGARLSQQYALLPYLFNSREARFSQLAGMVPYINAARRSMMSQEYALVVWTEGVNDVPRMSQHYALVPWASTPPGAENRTRAWVFTLDGHLFYVLDLGQEGTYVFDQSTSQWSQFRTEGFLGWNMKVGTTWEQPNRVVAGDTQYGEVWEMSPTDLLDEEFRPIEHIATGGISTRSRTGFSVDSLRVTGSFGALQDDENGVVTKMKFSDDAGKTWSEEYSVTLPAEDWDGEIAYRSLGTFAAPGRVFSFSDLGGMLRIDGADLFIDDFDSQAQLGSYQRPRP